MIPLSDVHPDVVAWLLYLTQGLLDLALAPLLLGCIGYTRARLQRRRGPHPLQPLVQLVKLMRKRPTISRDLAASARFAAPTATAQAAHDPLPSLFTTFPLMIFACYAAVGFLVPAFALWPPQVQLPDDLLLIVALVAFARFLTGLAGMVTGSPVGGLGASREMFLYVLSAPMLILATCALALLLPEVHSVDSGTYTTSLHGLLFHLATALNRGQLLYMSLPRALLFLSLPLALIVLFQGSRLPIAAPSTTLELTTLGKAAWLEYSGPHLALLQWADALHLFLFVTLFTDLFGLWWFLGTTQQGWWYSPAVIGAYFLRLAIVPLLIATWELTQTRLRIGGLTVLAILVLVLLVLAMLVTDVIPS